MLNTKQAPSFVEEECGCGRVWRGKKGCQFSCDECYPMTSSMEDEMEMHYLRQHGLIDRDEARTD